MSQTATYQLSFTVNSALVPSLTPPPTATVGQAYSFQLQASGGVSPYHFSATGLPSGLSCSTAGLISGTPTAAGNFTATITVTDSGA